MTPACIEAEVDALTNTAARFRLALVCRADVEAQRLLDDLGELTETVRVRLWGGA